MASSVFCRIFKDITALRRESWSILKIHILSFNILTISIVTESISYNSWIFLRTCLPSMPFSSIPSRMPVDIHKILFLPLYVPLRWNLQRIGPGVLKFQAGWVWFAWVLWKLFGQLLGAGVGLNYIKFYEGIIELMRRNKTKNKYLSTTANCGKICALRVEFTSSFSWWILLVSLLLVLQHTKWRKLQPWIYSYKL